jgi:hypothetical protein
MTENQLVVEQIDFKQAIIIFNKLLSSLKQENQHTIKEINDIQQQINYFENNISLIKSSKYYRFRNFIKNIIQLK